MGVQQEGREANKHWNQGFPQILNSYIEEAMNERYVIRMLRFADDTDIGIKQRKSKKRSSRN